MDELTGLIERHLDGLVGESVEDTPAVMVNGSGQIGKATAHAQDFKGLRKLQAQTGQNFITGIVLYAL